MFQKNCLKTFSKISWFAKFYLAEYFTLLNSRKFSQESILQFIRPTPNRTFNCYNPTGIKLITRFRLGLSHLRDRKFKHNFLGCLNPICCCGKDIENNVHYVLHCPIFSDERSIFFQQRSKHQWNCFKWKWF